MKKIINYKLVTRRAFLLAYDMIAVCCSNFLALLLRYEFQLDDIPGYFIFSATMFKNTVYRCHMGSSSGQHRDYAGTVLSVPTLSQPLGLCGGQ